LGMGLGLGLGMPDTQAKKSRAAARLSGR
jgi:hypothetical protein